MNIVFRILEFDDRSIDDRIDTEWTMQVEMLSVD